MKLMDWLGTLSELCLVCLWAFVIITMVGFKDLWIEIFVASPEIGGILTWAMLLIFAVQGIKYVGFNNLSKSIKELWGAWKEDSK